MPSPTKDTKILPAPLFRNLSTLDRYRCLCLWLPVKLATNHCPWGYKINPKTPKIAFPDEIAREAYIKAMKYLRNHSYVEVSEWLVSKGHPITKDGLRKLVSERPIWPQMRLPLEERLKL